MEEKLQEGRTKQAKSEYNYVIIHQTYEAIFLGVAKMFARFIAFLEDEQSQYIVSLCMVSNFQDNNLTEEENEMNDVTSAESESSEESETPTFMQR